MHRDDVEMKFYIGGMDNVHFFMILVSNQIFVKVDTNYVNIWHIRARKN